MFEAVTGRRRFAVIVGSAAAGVALAGGGASAVGATQRAKRGELKKIRTVPWPYTKLEPDAVAARAFEAYQKGHCMYGAFEAIVGSAADRLGEPYVSFPFEMMEYGAGGVSGWGTICGALNGSAAAFQLLSRDPKPLVDALFTMYERTPLPDLELRSAKFPNVRSVAGSPLCHTSVSRWCEKSGKRSYGPERAERCGVLTASVVRTAVEFLNLQAAGKPLPAARPETGAAGTCMKCHEKGGQVEDTRTRMDCQGCHFHLGGEHPSV
jgi:Putative redox-active protein (C_GCAxxG_C_C)